jgi:hypothetical protein
MLGDEHYKGQSSIKPYSKNLASKFSQAEYAAARLQGNIVKLDLMKKWDSACGIVRGSVEFNIRGIK